MHHASCPNVGSKTAVNCPACAKRYAGDSLDKGKVSKLKMAYLEKLGRGSEGNPVEKSGNPCSNQKVDSYLSYVNIEQKRVGVPISQENPVLGHVFAELLRNTRSRAQLEPSLAQHITITTYIALF